MKDVLFDQCLFDTSRLARIDSKCTRIHFQGGTKSPRLDADALTSLHVQSMSDVEIRTWKKACIEIELPTRVYPFELYATKRRIILREKPSKHGILDQNRVIIRAPYRLDLINLVLSEYATCETDTAAHLMCVLTKDSATATVAGEHLIAQSYDNSSLTATLVAKKYKLMNHISAGQVLAVNAGRGLSLYGTYSVANVVCMNGAPVNNFARGERLFGYRFPSSGGASSVISLKPTDGPSPEHFSVGLNASAAQLRDEIRLSTLNMLKDLSIRP